MTENIIRKTVSLSLYDINRLSKYENKGEIISKALDLFVERERKTIRRSTQKYIAKKLISFGINTKTLKYLKSISSNAKTDSQRYVSFSEIVRTALKDFWKIEDSPILETNEPDTRDYLERNGIKVIRIA
jgi:hypothetical protein